VRYRVGLPAGEYRSHLWVKIIDDNVEASTAAANPDNTKKQAQILFKANLVLIIPVIVPVTALVSTHTEKCSTGRRTLAWDRLNKELIF
jgi:hypothetical protein